MRRSKTGGLSFDKDYTVHAGTSSLELFINIDVTFASPELFSAGVVRARFEEELLKLRLIFERYATETPLPFPPPNI